MPIVTIPALGSIKAIISTVLTASVILYAAILVRSLLLRATIVASSTIHIACGVAPSLDITAVPTIVIV